MIRDNLHPPAANADRRPDVYGAADLLADLQRLIDLGLVRPTSAPGGMVRYEIADPAATDDDAA